MSIDILKTTLATGWNRNLAYAPKLVADLSDEQMVLMPTDGTHSAIGANHPAWAFCHMNLYHPAIVAMLRGETFEDPKDGPFGMKTKPEPDASLYPSRDEIIAAYKQGHADVLAALDAADESNFAAPMTLARWQEPFPTVGSMLGYIMLVHESTHLGQVSAWRRVLGLPSV